MGFAILIRFDFVPEKHKSLGTCVFSILKECYEIVKNIAAVISEACLCRRSYRNHFSKSMLRIYSINVRHAILEW